MFHTHIHIEQGSGLRNWLLWSPQAAARARFASCRMTERLTSAMGLGAFAHGGCFRTSAVPTLEASSVQRAEQMPAHLPLSWTSARGSRSEPICNSEAADYQAGKGVPHSSHDGSRCRNRCSRRFALVRNTAQRIARPDKREACPTSGNRCRALWKAPAARPPTCQGRVP